MCDGHRLCVQGRRQCSNTLSRVSAVQDETSDGMYPLICFHIRVRHEAVPQTWTQHLKTLPALNHAVNFHNIMDVDERLGRLLPCSCFLIFENLNKTRVVCHILTQDVPSFAILQAKGNSGKDPRRTPYPLHQK